MRRTIEGMTVNDDLTPGLRRAQRDLDDLIAGAMTTARDRVIADARAKAPVDTGRFRGSIEGTERSGRVGVRVGVPYADAVHAKGSKDPSWKVLIAEPMAAAADDVARRIGRDIADIVEG